MVLSSAALYPVPTQQGVQSIVLFYWFGLCCYIQQLTSKGNLLSTDNILRKTVAPKGSLWYYFYQIMSTDNAQINEKTLPQITVRLLFATSSRFAFYQYNHKSSALCADFSVFSRQSCVPSTRTCCLTVFSKPLFSYVACTYQVYLQAGHNVQK